MLDIANIGGEAVDFVRLKKCIKMSRYFVGVSHLLASFKISCTLTPTERLNLTQRSQFRDYFAAFRSAQHTAMADFHFGGRQVCTNMAKRDCFLHINSEFILAQLFAMRVVLLTEADDRYRNM
jgi:hypothetical protein